jgi:hypothetical protein
MSSHIKSVEDRVEAVQLALASAQWMAKLGREVNLYVFGDEKSGSKGSIWSGQSLIQQNTPAAPSRTDMASDTDESADETAIRVRPRKAKSGSKLSLQAIEEGKEGTTTDNRSLTAKSENADEMVASKGSLLDLQEDDVEESTITLDTENDDEEEPCEPISSASNQLRQLQLISDPTRYQS